jgi:hypothetical protein
VLIGRPVSPHHLFEAVGFLFELKTPLCRKAEVAGATSIKEMVGSKIPLDWGIFVVSPGIMRA